MDWYTELYFAEKIARKAGALQLETAGSISNIEIKSDHSPVTLIDKKCESLIVDQINIDYAQDGILGEESGEKKGKTNRIWVIDPIDGTRPFIRGIPTYSVLIALLENDLPVVGVIYLPALNLLYKAAKDQGAFCNDHPLKVSSTSTLSSAMGSGLGFIQKQKEREGQALFSLMSTWDYSYGFMDAYSYGCVCSGKLDLCVNLLDKPWDCAAAACIIEEAGGMYSDIDGNKTIFSGNIVISNKNLHQQVINFLAKSRKERSKPSVSS